METASESWRRNLYVISIAEFIVIVGFGLFNPFMPLFIQRFGNFSSGEAAFWAGLATGGAGFAMFFSSPLWGMAADRWSRKPMLLRAQFGGAIIIGLYVLAPNVYVFVGLRMIQGLFTGTLAAASALIATLTPRDKIPFAMGIFMAAVFAGNTMGPLIGGVMADTLGFKTTFLATSGLLAVGGLIILFFIREKFQRPEKGQRVSLKDMLRLAVSRDILPLLMIVAVLNLGPRIITPVIALVIEEVSSAQNAASAAGLAIALTGVVAAISSLVTTRIGGRKRLRKILLISCIGTGLLYFLPYWASNTAQMVILVGLTGLLMGGIVTTSNSMVSYSVPVEQQGIAYGLSQSANSLGNGLGPITGGLLGSIIGLRPVFLITGVIFILVGLLSVKLLQRQPVTGKQQVA